LVAKSIVLANLNLVSSIIYDLAVYNLAGDTLINYAHDISATIATITWSTGIATVTTTTAHGFLGGDPIVIAAQSPTGYNSPPEKSFQISVTSSTVFTYALVNDPGTQTMPGTASEIYFQTLRAKWNIYGFVSGIISSSNDESTGQSLVTPEKMKNLTMANLQNLKTPYGRQYMAFIESYGPIWGVS